MLANLFSNENSGDTFVFEKPALMDLAYRHKDTYNNAEPFPHVVIDNFLPERVANRVLAEFPNPQSPVWSARDPIHQPQKLDMGSAERLVIAPPYIQSILFLFNAYAMIEFLEALTDIAGLIPDPHLTGGGMHQTLSGGSLAIHADFNYVKKLKLYRRINVLLYLNKSWKDEYGGHLELWNPNMTHCVTKILPIFNRCAIFNTSQSSYHGHPEPLNIPKHMTRKSLALYYYTHDPIEGEDDIRLIDWKDRPSEFSRI